MEKDGLDDLLNTEKDEESLMVFGRNLDEPIPKKRVIDPPMKDLEHSIAIDSGPLEDQLLNNNQNPFDIGQ